MFDKFRQQLNDLLDRATPPEDRRAMVARMKETLVQARMGLDDLRSGLSATRVKLKLEEKELETIQRRKGLAVGINDAETVRIAERFESQQAEKVQVLRAKLEAQEAELALGERDVSTMTEELRSAAAGIGPGAATTAGGGSTAPGSRAEESDTDGSSLGADLEALSRTRSRADREAAAEAKLAELKRRMAGDRPGSGGGGGR